VAEIRKIARRPELSAFQREASTGGSATLLALAGSMNAAYERLRPAGLAQMQREADADWAGQARRDMGNPGGMVTASGGSSFRSALRQSESGGRADVVNSEGFTGLYQWGQPRLDDYNAATGQNITMEQFRGDAGIQEAAQDWHEGDILGQLGGYVGTTVNGQVLDEGAIIGMAHLGGMGGARQYIETGGAYNPSDSNGTSLSDYAQRFAGLSVSGGGNLTVSTQSAPATIIQKADGSLQPRLYSPGSGEFLEAYNAAAQVLYRNEAELETTAALMNLSNQYTLDPDGFQQAARGYIEETLKNVPDMFRPELRAVMAEQVQRRALGILEDKQADIRQRAANSNQALIEKHSKALSDAMVAGNPDAIAKAEADLRSQLIVRESLPGQAWTPEQTGNYIAGAREDAQAALEQSLDEKERVRLRAAAEAERAQMQMDRISGAMADAVADAQVRAAKVQQENRAKAKAEMDRQLRLVRDAALSGQKSAYDALLMGPFTDAIDPALLEEATAARAMADGMPGFLAATPADRAATIADLRAQPVTSSMDQKTVEAFERADRLVTEAFQKDPIAAAAAYLPQKPQQLPPISDPQAYGEGLKARLEYGRMLQAGGYTLGVPLFSKAEREQAGALFGKGVPAEAKMVAAVAVVEALGEDAGLFFEQAKSDDRVSLVVGQMLASGGDATVGLEAMRGQEMLDAGVAKRPKVPPVQAVSTDIATALSGLMVPDTVTDVAAAILVARGHAETDLKTVDGKKALEAAMQSALGQTSDPVSKKTYGGVQMVVREQTLLPPDISGQDLSIAIERAMTTPPTDFLASAVRAIDGAVGIPNPEPRQISPQDAWTQAGGLGAPLVGGAPIPDIAMGDVVIRPVGNSGMYQLFVKRADGGMTPAHVQMAPNIPYLFSPAELIRATQ
jgi:hypothetical protein